MTSPWCNATERCSASCPEPAAEPPTIDRFFSNVGKAFEAFERTLIARESRFDSFARGLRTGDQDLVDRLGPAAQRGLALFIGRARCIQCHHGPGFSDGEFHNLGLDTPEGTAIDVGRYDGVELAKDHPFRGTGPHSDDPSESANQRLSFVTRKLNNFGEFKTPSLRNVAQTGPYMHDGRFESLRDVVEFYSTLPAEPAVGHREESLRRLALSPVDIDDLVAFLRSLTDDHAIRAATSTSTSPPPRTKRP